MNEFLQGKSAVVTGGARNIGRVLVEYLARAGAQVVFGDVLLAEGEATAAELRAEGYHVTFQPADVRDPAQVEALAVSAAQTAPLGVWVHNAMVDVRRSVVDLEPDEWDTVQAVCLRAAYLGAKYALPRMGPGSSIINISSVHALVTYAHAAAYAAAKAGLIALTRQLAAEYGPRGIRINALAPGLTEYPDVTEDYNQQSLPYYPLGRIGTAQDIANALLFLASDAASFINGVALVIDGGMTTRSPEWFTHAALDDQLGAG